MAKQTAPSHQRPNERAILSAHLAMPRPQFSLKTMLWVATLVTLGAGVTSNILRHPGEGAWALVQWLLIGAVVGGFVGLFVREPMAFMLFGVGAALTLLLLLAMAAALCF